MLRRPAARDVDAIVVAVSDVKVARCLSCIPHPYGPADAAFFLDEVVPYEWTWGITGQDSDTLIGSVGLTPSETQDTAELGDLAGAAVLGMRIGDRGGLGSGGVRLRNFAPAGDHLGRFREQPGFRPLAGEARLH